ncbi:MAG: Transcriptional regulatory protein PadR [Microbacteriaceae bacterium]|jgi:ribosomal protein S18 acetylase RimI-like enzyme|nr:Transcriptional regulatory protein PadR [Microbacteriaceae bacterium]
MVTWRETSTTDAAAAALLTEYFHHRELGFPAERGPYRVTPPVPEQFEPPRGVFLVVEGEDLAGEPADVGCGGIRLIEPGVDGAVRYEVKHLWLQPHTRRLGYGRALLAELERRAREFGAEELVLDTNSSLEAAGNLYRSSGFVNVEPFNDNPNATDWFSKTLAG